MGQYLIRRLLSMVPVLLLVSVITFSLLLLLPGDPAEVMLGEEATPEELHALRIELGLYDPIPVQYINWLGKALRGDLGHSLRTKLPTAQAITQRLPITLQLVVFSSLWAVIIALPVGIISATRPNSFIDNIGTFFAITGAAVPHFWLGIMLILFFAVVVGILPASGFVNPLQDLPTSLKLTILPAVTMGTSMAAVVMRQMRASLMEALQEDYITTARAKGLQEVAVVSRHAMKNALIPVITVVGLHVGRAFGGAVITETIFAIPGIGRLAVDSINSRDFPVLQAVVLVLGLAVLVSNLLVDIAYAYVDPRIRYS